MADQERSDFCVLFTGGYLKNNRENNSLLVLKTIGHCSWTNSLFRNFWSIFIPRLGIYAEKRYPEKRYVACWFIWKCPPPPGSFYHEPLHTWIETNVNQFAIPNQRALKLDVLACLHTNVVGLFCDAGYNVQALRNYLMLISEYGLYILSDKKLVPQRIMVKTIWRTDHPWSAIFCVMVYSESQGVLESPCIRYVQYRRGCAVWVRHIFSMREDVQYQSGISSVQAKICSTLASVSFWLLLIIESVVRVSQHVVFTHDLLVKQV